MTKRPLFLFGASALALGLAPAAAQDTDYADECVDLFAFVEDTPSLNLDDEPEIVSIIERNDARACQLRLTRLQRSAQDVDTRERAQPMQRIEREEADRLLQRDDDQDRERIQREVMTTEATEVEQVEVEQTVTVRGNVDVVAPLPNVSVRPSPADVDIQHEAPRVTVRQQQPEIVVREQAATITVGMPTITIEQDAPEIIVTMPDPDVNVEMGEPQVEVRQAPPRVTVAVPEPRVDLDLSAGVGDTAEPVRTRVRRERGEVTAPMGLRQADSADANVFVGEAEPNVQVQGLDSRPQVSVESAEPSVRFENAEPNVRVQGEPEVRFERRGEPRVRFERAGAETRQQRFAGVDRDDRDDRMDREERRERRTATSRTSGSEAIITVGRLVGQTVRGADGETIGEIDRVIRLDGRTYAVVEHGGFLGLGDTDIPIPLTELRRTGDRLTATNMTEERAEQMQANDIERGQDVPRAEAVRLGV